jgi:hypothetical protein
MVKKLAKFLGYILFFILAVIYFAPKVELYYMAEKELSKYDVIISNERVTDSGFSLNLSDASLYVKSVNSALAKSVDITLLGVYNSASLEDITLSSTASAFLPLHIKSIDVKYTLFNPLNATLYSKGEFGELDGYVNLQKRALHIDLKPSKVMLKKYRSSLSQLKKNKDGSYSYDKNL